MHTKAVLALFVLALISLSIYGYSYVKNQQDKAFIEQVFSSVESIDSYVQRVETELTVAERTVTIQGVYKNDRGKSAYASESTTTVQVPGSSSLFRFSTENIALDNRVYVRVRADEGTPTTVPADVWHTFDFASIPKEFETLAIPGPVLDNLLLFSEGGRYLRLESAQGADTTFGVNALRYRFSASGVKPETPSPLTVLLERIGPGTIDVWVGASSTLEALVITNPPYYSTTTLSDFNNPLGIAAPQE
jgi:hypothetical protein